jgi:cell division protease FtsH
METKEKPSDSPRVPSWLWWIVLLGLLAWVYIVLQPSGAQQAEIPYSTFVKQVQDGNVAQVHISGNQITGQFVNPITWPQATPAPTAGAAGSSGSASGSTATPAPTAGATSSSGSASGSTTSSAKYADFQTVFPQDVGDPNLMPLLQSKGVQVDVSNPSTPLLPILLSYGLPVLLIVGVVVWMTRRATPGGQSGIFNFGRSRARRDEGNQTRVTFDDVAGADEAKAELEEVVDFLRSPAKYHEIGARIPRGVLLVGPPGTGKTLMARAIAGEAHVPFFHLSASEFVEMFVGVGASRVRDLFEQAKQAAPAIVFIDELDAVGRRRGAGVGNVNDEREQTLNQLLVEMDGFDERHEVILLAATNRPDVLDPALLRPGRFDRQVTVALPDRKGREGILRIHTRRLRLDPQVDLGVLAGSTTGFSGADLANLCNEAALEAARENHPKIAMADFDEAVDRIVLGGARPLLLSEKDRRIVAYHEAGHALVAWLTPEADPVHKVTIIPRGRALGVTTQVPGEDQYNYSRAYLLARLAVMLGGRTSEELALEEITTGAESDLVEATRLARRMITRWGMGELGLIAFKADDEQPFLGYELSQGRDYSESTAARIDEEVESLLEERHGFVQRLLTDARPKLDMLVEALLKEETVDRDAMTKLLGPRPEVQPVIKEVYDVEEA